MKTTSMNFDGQVSAWNFDWDDNIVHMSTKIILFKKGQSDEKAVTTREFAVIRNELTDERSSWSEYEVRPGSKTGSFRNFRDISSKNDFLEDLKVTLGASDQWKGPSWNAFVRALSSKRTARWTTIITARGHSEEKMHDGLRFLQAQGLIKELPPIENIYPLGGDKGYGDQPDLSHGKVTIMREILDQIQEIDFGPTAAPVLDRDGRSKEVLHLWGFSDDDHGNFRRAVSELAKEVDRWSRIKITVYFTGKNHPDVKPHALVIGSGGRLRSILEEETIELRNLIGQHQNLEGRRAQ